MTRSNHQTKLSDPAWSWYHILSCLHEEEELPIKDTGNKVVLVVKLWLFGWAKSYCLIYVVWLFWKGEGSCLQGAHEEVLLLGILTISQQWRWNASQALFSLPLGCSAQEKETGSSELEKYELTREKQIHAFLENVEQERPNP